MSRNAFNADLPLLPSWFTALPEYYWLSPTERMEVMVAEADLQLRKLQETLADQLADYLNEVKQELYWSYQEAVWRLNEKEADVHKAYLEQFWQPLIPGYGQRTRYGMLLQPLPKCLPNLPPLRA